MTKLVELRQQRGLSARDVAIETGLTERTILNAEKDPTSLVSRNLCKIADFYGVKTDLILERI